MLNFQKGALGRNGMDESPVKSKNIPWYTLPGPVPGVGTFVCSHYIITIVMGTSKKKHTLVHTVVLSVGTFVSSYYIITEVMVKSKNIRWYTLPGLVLACLFIILLLQSWQ